MNSKRSYLDTLNDGRQRRGSSSIEELGRALDEIGSRLDRSLADASRRGALRQPEPAPAYRPSATSRPAAYEGNRFAPNGSYGRESVDSIARSIETSRRQEREVAAIAGIATELQEMRAELRAQMGNGIQREFQSLRSDIDRLYEAAISGAHGAELTRELERLSDAIGSLAARSGDDSTQLLRAELDEVKSAISHLAREETVLNFERGWRDMGARFDAFEARMATAGRTDDPAMESLQDRLDQIARAVAAIPESLSLRTLEDEVRSLANAMDHFASMQPADNMLYGQIGERLDEISRAIIASSMNASTQAQPTDEQFERIEARISSLARQIEELANDRPTGELIDRINHLTRRVDEMNRNAQLPDEWMERLVVQLDDIAGKIAAGVATQDGELVVRGLEDRFDTLAETLQRQQADADSRGMSIFRELESRIGDLMARMDEPVRLAELPAAPAFDPAVLRNLEERLEDISARIEETSRQAPVIDPAVISSLETQVADLAAHLASPGQALREFEDIGPRLAQIEQALADNREAIVESARVVAEETIRHLSGSKSQDAETAALASELKALEGLTRRADERNSRGFEAIHDTLLKIVDRLSAAQGATVEPRAAFAPLQIDTPPLEPTLVDAASEPRDEQPSAPRSPAKAASAAADAALRDADDLGQPEEKTRKSRLGGLTSAFARRRAKGTARPLAGDTPPVMEAGQAEPTIDIDEAIDPKAANRPLEPGSGAPDLASIMRRVRDDRSHPAGGGDAKAAKADFVAAARRAAQAAAAETETHRKDDKNSGKTSLLGGIFSRHRKTMLMAAGGVVLALAAMQLGRAFFADNVNAAARSAAIASNATPPAAAPSAAQPPAMSEAEPSRQEEAAGDQAGMQPAPTEPETAAAAIALDTDESDEANAAGLPEEIQDAPLAADATPAVEPIETASLPPVAAPAKVEVPASAGPAALREAAEGGDPKAMFEIANRYTEGRGTKQDLAEAARWYERAADAGFAPAQYRIGNFYEKGTGVERDIAKARTWYQLAAQQGNASAMHNLAVLYAMGADGTTDNDSAGRWFMKAAELGVKDSQFNLGILSAKGVGVPQSLEESYKWFALVAKSGDKDAEKKRDEVARAMRPEQLEDARARAELWRPKALNLEANEVTVPDGWREDGGKTASVDMKKAVRNIQLLLNKNGYDAGGADGVLGAKTKAAIAAFQKDNGLAATGEIDEHVVTLLLNRT